MEFILDEAKEEAYFEKHFEYDTDQETTMANMAKALKEFEKAYKATNTFAENAEDGEVFDSEAAADAFANLALSYKYCLEFMKNLDEDVQMKIVENATKGSAQEFVSLFLKSVLSTNLVLK